jgi:hypothetical protein
MLLPASADALVNTTSEEHQQEQEQQPQPQQDRAQAVVDVERASLLLGAVPKRRTISVDDMWVIINLFFK